MQRKSRNQRDRAFLRAHSQHASDRFAQLRLPNGFQQIRRHSQLLAARRISAMASRSQHHNRGGGQLRPLPNGLDQRESVHFRHVHIGQDQPETGFLHPAPLTTPPGLAALPPPMSSSSPIDPASPPGFVGSFGCRPRQRTRTPRRISGGAIVPILISFVSVDPSRAVKWNWLPCAHFALHPDFSTHHLHQPRRNG